jgi:hypothetical protein
MIAASIGFTPDMKDFYNGEYTAPDIMPEGLEICLNNLLYTKQFKQILLCSMLGLGAAYLGKSIVPVINIFGTGLGSEFVKTLILSPFGKPGKGYRDIFCKEKSDSMLAFDRDIIPVVADLYTYGDRDLGFEWSGDGYYLEGHGQFHAPLFIISRTPYFKDIHIPIEIPLGIMVGKNHFYDYGVDIQYEEITKYAEMLSAYVGQLSFYIARQLCANNITADYKSKLSEMMDLSDYRYDEEKRCMIDALGYAMQNIMMSMFSFKEEDWLFEWGGIHAEIDQQARETYYTIVSAIEKKKLKLSDSAEEFTDHNYGFTSRKHDKRFLHIQEGSFNLLFSRIFPLRRHVIDYWIDVKGVDIYRSNRKYQPYVKREFVGPEKKHRRWFYVFCMSDLEDIYPPRDPFISYSNYGKTGKVEKHHSELGNITENEVKKPRKPRQRPSHEKK